MNDPNPPTAVQDPSDGRGLRVRDVTAPRLIRLMILIALALTALSVTGLVVRHTMVKGVEGRQWLDHPIRHFDLNREGNTPTLYQALSLLLCAAALWGIGYAEAANPTNGAAGHDRRRATPRAWRGLALIFLYLACDEHFKLHERTIDPLRAWLNIREGVLRYAWVIPGAAVVALVALAYARFWFRLPRDTRWRFALAAVLFVGGALGMELVAGRVHTDFGYNSLPYIAAAQVEEVLEMAGVIVFMHALLRHAAVHVEGPLRLGRVAVRVNSKARDVALSQ